jgi:hypothetical protein
VLILVKKPQGIRYKVQGIEAMVNVYKIVFENISKEKTTLDT